MGDSLSDLPKHPQEIIDLVTQLKELNNPQIVDLFNGFCSNCFDLLKSRLRDVNYDKVDSVPSKDALVHSCSTEINTTPNDNNIKQQHNNVRDRSGTNGFRTQNQDNDSLSPAQVNNGKPQMRNLFDLDKSSNGSQSPSLTKNNGLSDDEWRRFSQVVRKKNFVHYEKVNGKEVNVLQGLELHKGVFSVEEQKQIVESVYNFQKMGRKGQLMARTYSEPVKWMRGKGRVTIQFGCCYNYAVDRNGNPPGIIRDEEVDPLPPVFKKMISRMVRWHVLPPTCVPNSCIVNIYDEGDCIPPHIDHHDFVRPFCTVSFLTECNILFGSNLKIAGPGDFVGPVSIPLPVGSVLILSGNGADIAKHCVPAVPAKRISVTFRRMDESKIPHRFTPDPELLNLTPLRHPSMVKTSPSQHPHQAPNNMNGTFHKKDERKAGNNNNNTFVLQNNDFPALGSLKLRNR